MQINILVRGVEKVVSFLSIIPKNIMRVALDASANYLMGAGGGKGNKLSIYPAYRYVSRRSAYGKPFKNQAQQAYVMSKIKSGEIRIPYNRTNLLDSSWKAHGMGSFYKRELVNACLYAPFVIGDKQSRHEALVGWRKYYTADFAGAINYAKSAVRLFLQSLKRL
jgi:hypothetical protein